MQDIDNTLTTEEKDNFFIHVCFETIKKETTISILPFLIFILYISIRLAFRGNATVFYLTYKNILIYAIISILVLFVYGLAITFHLNDFLKKKVILSSKAMIVSMVEGLSLALSYIVFLFFLYCVIFIGAKSLLDFKYGFSIFPILKFLIFSLFSIPGILSVLHIIKLGKLLSEKKQLVNTDSLRGILQEHILAYIFSNKLYKPKG